MPVFFDDFNRANGAPGNGWNGLVTTININNNALTGTGLWTARQDNVQEVGRHEASARITGSSASGLRSGVGVKVGTNANEGFTLMVQGDSSPYSLRIMQGLGVNGMVLASVSLSGPLPPYYELKLIWDDGELTGFYEGTPLVTYSTGLYFTNLYMGACGYSSVAPILDFNCVGGSAVGLAVDPNVIGNYGACTQLALVGTNTAWTPGTPGSPTFTVDHGTITAQTITDATHATITYCPGDYLGSIIFTDPSTGATVGAVVTSDPAIIPPSAQCPFDEGFIEMANRSDLGQQPIIASNNLPIAFGLPNGPDLTLQNALADLWYSQFRSAVAPPSGWTGSPALLTIWSILNGGLEHTSQSNVLDLLIVNMPHFQTLLQNWSELRGAPEWTLQDLLDLIRGTGDWSITDVYERIGSTDLQPVLDAIAAARGTPAGDIRTVITALDGLRTINDWTLGNVKDWIEAIDPGSLDLSPVLTAISNVNTHLTNVETNIRNDIAAMGLVLTAVQLASGRIEATLGGVVESLTDILDILGNLPEPTVPPAAPIIDLTRYSIQAHDPIAFSAPFVHTADCHGCLYTISTQGQAVKGYRVGDHTALTGAGVVGFFGADSRPERFQYINWDRGVLLPLSFAKASGLVWSSNVSLSGTVTPFDLVPL